jgi:hypothetical protein
MMVRRVLVALFLVRLLGWGVRPPAASSPVPVWHPLVENPPVVYVGPVSA